MVLLKTKRREQAPAIRYEIVFSVKIAETRLPFPFYIVNKRFYLYLLISLHIHTLHLLLR